MVIDSSSLAFAGQVRRIVEKYGGGYYYEAKSGLSVARNKAIQLSKGNIIAFTDDDCIVDKNWIDYLVEGYSKSPRIMCVTGRTLPLQGKGALYEKLLSKDYGSRRRLFSMTKTPVRVLRLVSLVTETNSLGECAPIPWCVGSGNNMSFQRKLFSIVGMFDERLGAGTQQRGGEDLDTYFRIFSTGFEQLYEPRAIVFHKHKDTFEELAQTYYDNGRGDGSFMLKHALFLHLFARIPNMIYGSLKTLSSKDKLSCYLYFEYLCGILSSILHSRWVRSEQARA